MKKLSLILLMFFVVLTTTKAQDIGGENFRLGVSIINLSSGSLDLRSDTEVTKRGGRFATGFGLLFENPIKIGKTNKFWTSTGIFLTPNGGKYTADLDTTVNNTNTQEIETKLRFRTIEIPLTIKYRNGLKSNDKLHYFINTGFSPALSYSTRYDRKDINIEDAKAKDITSPFNLFFNFGGGIEYALGEKLALFAAFQVNRGLMNAITDEVDNKLGTSNTAIRAGIFF